MVDIYHFYLQKIRGKEINRVEFTESVVANNQKIKKILLDVNDMW